MSVTTGVGLVSGVDYESIIQQISQLNRRPIQIYERRQAVLQTQSQAYGQVSSVLTAFRDQVAKMLSQDDLTFRSAQAGNKEALDVSATDDAPAGSYSVEVLQLAQSARSVSQGFSDTGAPVAAAAGKFTLQVGVGVAQSYDVDATTTLADLRDMINADEDSKVTASIINDGSASNPFRLVLTSSETGSLNDISITTNDTSLNFTDKLIEAATANAQNQFNGTVTASGAYTGSGNKNVVMKMVSAGSVDGATPARFVVSMDGGLTFGDTEYNASATAQEISGGEGVEVTFGAGSQDFAVGDTFRIDLFDPTLQRAQDAMIRVDGIQVTSESNTFANVVEGVTLTAKATTTAATSVTVKEEAGLLNAEIVAFADAFNNMIKTVNQLTDYNEENKQAQPLFGDSTVRNLKNSITRMITSPIPGASGEFQTLSSIGLSIQVDGTLKYDVSKFNAAAEDGLEAIRKLFGRIGTSSDSSIKILNAGKETQAGNYRVNVTQAASRATVTGGATMTGGLAASEYLNFTVGESNFVVNFDAGTTLNSAVDQLNSAFASNGVNLQARNSNGSLEIQSKDFGNDQAFSVYSNQDGTTTNQLGIGTTAIDAQGTDVVATVNGRSGEGTGRLLTFRSGTLDGLSLEISAGQPTTSTINMTNGISTQLDKYLADFLDSSTGILQVRQDGLADSIDDMNNSIEAIEERVQSEAERLRAQFIAMEKQMSIYQGWGGYISQMASSLQQ